MGVWGATPEPKQYFLAVCSSNTPILGMQKHLFWPIGYSGMGVWGATPESRDIFWHCAVLTPPSHVSNNTFAGLWGTMVWVFGAPPQNPNNIFWQCAVSTLQWSLSLSRLAVLLCLLFAFSLSCFCGALLCFAVHPLPVLPSCPPPFGWDPDPDLDLELHRTSPKGQKKKLVPPGPQLKWNWNCS